MTNPVTVNLTNTVNQTTPTTRKTIVLKPTDTFDEPIFKEANSLLINGKREITEGQNQSGIEKIKKGLSLLKQIIETEYVIKTFPFDRVKVQEATELANATKDSATKLTKRYEQIIEDVQAGKTTVNQSSQVVSPKYTNYQAAHILYKVFGLEGLKDDLCKEDREKSFKILGITSEIEKAIVIKLALELPIIQARYEEHLLPNDDILLKKYGINNPNATYNDKPIEVFIEEFIQRLAEPDETGNKDKLQEPSGATFRAKQALNGKETPNDDATPTSPSLPEKSNIFKALLSKNNSRTIQKPTQEIKLTELSLTTGDSKNGVVNLIERLIKDGIIFKPDEALAIDTISSNSDLVEPAKVLDDDAFSPEVLLALSGESFDDGRLSKQPSTKS